MVQQILFPEWRDENEKIKYPFSDSSTMTNGTLTLPPTTFIDGRLYPIGGNELLYMNRITRDGSVVTIGIRASGTEELATASFSLSVPPDNGELVFTDDYGRPAGMLLSSVLELGTLGAVEQGTQLFTLAQAAFTAAVVVPQPDSGVRGVITEDGDVLSGEVWMVGERGVVLRQEAEAVRIDIVGDPYASRALCEDEEPQEGEAATQPVLAAFCPVKTINGYPADDYGNFELRVGSNQSETNIMRITGQRDTLRIELLGQRRFRGV